MIQPATMSRQQTTKNIESVDEVYQKHMSTFKNHIDKAIKDSKYDTELEIIKPSSRAIDKLKAIGYLITLYPAKPIDGTFGAARNAENEPTKIKINWQ